jgi:hypothetical protein
MYAANRRHRGRNSHYSWRERLEAEAAQERRKCISAGERRGRFFTQQDSCLRKPPVSIRGVPSDKYSIHHCVYKVIAEPFRRNRDSEPDLAGMDFRGCEVNRVGKWGQDRACLSISGNGLLYGDLPGLVRYAPIGYLREAYCLQTEIRFIVPEDNDCYLTIASRAMAEGGFYFGEVPENRRWAPDLEQRQWFTKDPEPGHRRIFSMYMKKRPKDRFGLVCELIIEALASSQKEFDTLVRDGINELELISGNQPHVPLLSLADRRYQPSGTRLRPKKLRRADLLGEVWDLLHRHGQHQIDTDWLVAALNSLRQKAGMKLIGRRRANEQAHRWLGILSLALDSPHRGNRTWEVTPAVLREGCQPDEDETTLIEAPIPPRPPAEHPKPRPGDLWVRREDLLLPNV